MRKLPLTPTVPPARVGGEGVVRRARPLLGTLVEMRVEGLRELQALAAIDAAFAEVEVVHRLMSFHETESDLARVHRTRVGEAVALDARTLEVLRCALQIAELSSGAFDPSIAARAVASGGLPWPDSPFVPQAQASWRDIELLDAQHVRLRRPLWLDLGGIAKGYAVDRAIEILMRAGATQACVNAGGDLRIAGPRTDAVTLRIAQCDAAHTVELRDGAIATSASASLFARANMVEACDCLGASVAAPRCMLADALTKVALLADAETAGATLAHFDAQAVIHARDGWRGLAHAA